MNLRTGGLAILAFVTALASGRTVAREEPTRLKVMTYNIRVGAGGGDRRSDPRKTDLEPLARIIAEQAPDIVGLQEVDQFRPRSASIDQPAWLSQRLKLNVQYVPALTIPSGSAPEEKYGVALLSKPAIQSCERIPLFKPDYSTREPPYSTAYSEQRVLLHAVVSLAGRQVRVFVTHLGLTADQRAQQVKQIAQIAARNPGPKLLMGDFNAEPGEPAMALLKDSFKDALSAAGTPADKRKSFPAGTQPRGAIDYIFVSPEFRVISARVILDASLASDHNPVVAELELTSGP